MSRLLLFDLGGVLIENDMFTELRRLLREEASPAELIERWLANPVARRFELGQCSADDFAREIVADFRLDMTPSEFLSAFASWPKGFSPGALSLLKRLRQQHLVACLSNSNEVHWHDGLTRPFDHAFSSHLIGYIKPDPEAFEHALGTLGVAPEQVCYFDDAVSNVKAARDLGINAFRTVGFAALEAEITRLDLGRRTIPPSNNPSHRGYTDR